MRFDILTIFPNIFDSYINESIFKRAREQNLIQFYCHNIRDYAVDKHKTVDDAPYGGGPGMIFKVEPLYKCLKNVIGEEMMTARIRGEFKVQSSKFKVVLMTPRGRQFTQTKAEELAQLDRLVLICGRYEGIDARTENLADELISIGPYVLSGGELPAMVIVEAVTRLLPGVLGSLDSLIVESFHTSNSCHMVEYPQYTRPETFSPIPGVEWKVPSVLLSGDHQKIEEWRRQQF